VFLVVARDMRSAVTGCERAHVTGVRVFPGADRPVMVAAFVPAGRFRAVSPCNSIYPDHGRVAPFRVPDHRLGTVDVQHPERTDRADEHQIAHLDRLRCRFDSGYAAARHGGETVKKLIPPPCRLRGVKDTFDPALVD